MNIPYRRVREWEPWEEVESGMVNFQVGKGALLNSPIQHNFITGHYALRQQGVENVREG